MKHKAILEFSVPYEGIRRMFVGIRNDAPCLIHCGLSRHNPDPAGRRTVGQVQSRYALWKGLLPSNPDRCADGASPEQPHYQNQQNELSQDLTLFLNSFEKDEYPLAASLCIMRPNTREGNRIRVGNTAPKNCAMLLNRVYSLLEQTAQRRSRLCASEMK